MNRYVLAASTLSTAVGLALAIQALPARAADKQMEEKMQQMDKMEKSGSIQKCYGVAARGKNDCAGAGTQSCAGTSTKDRDPASYVALPKGDCTKIAGGKLKPA
jgi:uncharacterized membrane protein